MGNVKLKNNYFLLIVTQFASTGHILSCGLYVNIFYVK